MTFLSPLAGLVALAAALPLAAFAVGAHRLARVRAALGLPPHDTANPLAPAAAAAVVVLLALAAAQPAWTHTTKQRVRTDAQALFVVDVSQSMAAAATAASPTRLDRATSAAERLRAAIPQIASGVATLTDRVLPDLLPVPDAEAFDSTLTRSVGIEEPPPAQTDVRATSFGALAGVATHDYFDPTATKRIVVLLTDGESAPYDPQAVASAFKRAHIELLAVRFWGAGERIFDAQGHADTSYRPDPRGRAVLDGLASAAGGRAYAEVSLAPAAAQLRSLAGNGPTTTTGRAETSTPLGPYVAMLALLPLALVLRRRGLLLPARTP
ncbi:MAG: vWA domain-containing protein [Gaiellaceae bacterium]